MTRLGFSGGDRRISMQMCALMVSSLMLLAGCGETPPIDPSYGDEDLDAVSDLVGDISDRVLDVPRFEEMFASSSVPSEQQRLAYRGHKYRAEQPVIKGDAATIKVNISSVTTGESEGQVEWTAVKEGGKWKLKKAPPAP